MKYKKTNKHKINYFLYIVGIKLYAATEIQLNGLLRITETYMSDIKVEFRMSKCKVLQINKAQWKDLTKSNVNKIETY